MNWLFLIIAGLFEVGWPLGLKLAQTPSTKIIGSSLSIVSMALSGSFLYMAQKTIPMGTAYAVWTGIGTFGTLIVGVMFFGDSGNIWRLLSASLIIIGIVGIKLVH